MKVAKWKGHVPANFSTLFDDFLNHSFGNQISGSANFGAQPAVNVSESDTNYTIEFAAPGLDKEDFDIQITKDQLTVSVEKKVETEESDDDKKYSRKEFSYQSFTRSFHLSDEIDQDKISAEYDNGILVVTLDKAEDALPKAPKTIEIK